VQDAYPIFDRQLEKSEKHYFLLARAARVGKINIPKNRNNSMAIIIDEIIQYFRHYH
jgi:hypothetical protein